MRDITEVGSLGKEFYYMVMAQKKVITAYFSTPLA